MFTGIVEATGRIISVTPQGAGNDAGVQLEVDAGNLSLEDVSEGDSIAVNGACMTVVGKSGRTFFIDVSRESLNRTAGLDRVGEVNLEKALQVGERLGGHLVSGHVDAVGVVHRIEPVAESRELVIAAPRDLARYLAYKGSVAVDGVSLTINQVDDTSQACLFSINLIPHTIEATTFKHLVPGKKVNLEIDLVARYVERMMSVSSRK